MLPLQNINNEIYIHTALEKELLQDTMHDAIAASVETIRMRNDCDKNAYHDAI